MPADVLENASLDRNRACASAYSSDSTFYHDALRSAYSESDGSSRGKSKEPPDVRRSRSADGHSTTKSPFTTFTESLSHSSGDFHQSVQKTFSMIANSFSLDQGSTSGSSSGYGGSSGSSSSSHSSNTSKRTNKEWTDLILPDGLRSRVSSLTSRSSSYNSASSNDSSLSSRSESPRSKLDQFSITVDSSGVFLTEGEEDSRSVTDGSSVASWQETASRDRSLLDTIGESREEDDGSSQSSGSTRSYDNEEGEEVGIGDYHDDRSEFDSDVGLEDLGAAMLQIGSCHFESESGSMSDDDAEYSYENNMFPNFLGGPKSADSGILDDNTEDLSEAARNAAFQKQLKQRRTAKKGRKSEEDSLTSLFKKAFSCGTDF